MICLVSLTSRPQKGLAFEKGRALLTSLFWGVFGVLPFLFGQVQGGIHCPTWVWDLSLRLGWVGVRNGTSLEKKAEHFWCSAFFIWPSPGRNPLPDLGARLESETSLGGCQKRYLSWEKGRALLVFCLFYLAKSRAESTARLGLSTWVWDFIERVSETLLLFWRQVDFVSAKRQSTSDFSLWGVFGVLPFLFALLVWRHVVEKLSKSPLLMPTAISRWIHQFSSDHWS